VKNIYEVPLKFYEEGVDQKIAILLRLPAKNAELKSWKELVQKFNNPGGRVSIGIVGKYVDLKEAYKSLHEALVHGGVANDVAVDLVYVNSEEVTPDNVASKLRGLDGVLVPGGFGSRGIPGKVEAIRYAREKKIPFFGICLGMQCAVIEHARNILGLKEADSEEFNPLTADPVIYLMTEWYDFRAKCVVKRDTHCDKGGTMRLGAYPCAVKPGTKAFEAYGSESIEERHRHRFEFNNKYMEQFEEHGLIFSGLSPDGSLVEIVELADHPWFLGCQFHPEFKSTPMRPHPLFREFIRAAKERRG
jgi:CTP synthase